MEQAGKPGVSVAGLALKHGVNANQLRRWMRLQHLRRALPLPTLLPVTLAQPPAVGVATEVHASPIIETGRDRCARARGRTPDGSCPRQAGQ